MLLLENMWDQYVVPNGKDGGKNPTQPKKGWYTSAGLNRRHSGWSKEGIERFNDLAKLVAQNHLEDWVDTVEGEVIDRATAVDGRCLQAQYYLALTTILPQPSCVYCHSWDDESATN